MLALQALAAHAACAQLQSLLHAAEHMNALALVYTRRRAQRTPAHAMSHERADTYVVAFKVERPVTRQANGGARGLEFALLRERRRNRSRACGLARKHPRGRTRTDAPQHVMSLERADSCIVALRVDHTVAHPAAHAA